MFEVKIKFNLYASCFFSDIPLTSVYVEFTIKCDVVVKGYWIIEQIIFHW